MKPHGRFFAMALALSGLGAAAAIATPLASLWLPLAGLLMIAALVDLLVCLAIMNGYWESILGRFSAKKEEVAS